VRCRNLVDGCVNQLADRRVNQRLDEGSITPLIVAIIALTSLVALAMSHAAEATINAHRASTAAEALALAAAVDGNLDEIAHLHEVEDSSWIMTTRPSPFVSCVAA